MFTSNRIPHVSGMYHEHIFHDNQVVAQVLSESDHFWFVLTHDHSVSNGYQSVADAKQELFRRLDRIYR